MHPCSSLVSHIFYKKIQSCCHDCCRRISDSPLRSTRLLQSPPSSSTTLSPLFSNNSLSTSPTVPCCSIFLNNPYIHFLLRHFNVQRPTRAQNTFPNRNTIQSCVLWLFLCNILVGRNGRARLSATF